MLREIHIKNFAIIGNLSVYFEKGLNVITGETGAGKSILIDALSVALGGRAYTEQIKTGEKTATISVVFDIDDNIKTILDKIALNPDDDLITIKRIISLTEKNRAFINDIPISLTIINEMSSRLLDIHGQHEHQFLLHDDFKLDIVDGFGDLFHFRNEVEDIYREFYLISNKLKDLEKKLLDRKRDKELFEFQHNELKNSDLIIDEEIKLEEKIKILTNSEKLQNKTRQIYNRLSEGDFSLYHEIHNIKKELEDLAEIDEKIDVHVLSIENIEIAIGEISEFLLKYSEKIDVSHHRLEESNARLSLITSLSRKYGYKSSEGLICLKEELESKLSNYVTDDDMLVNYKDRITDLSNKLKSKSFALSDKRKKIAVKLGKLVVNEFKELGIEKGRFEIDVKKFPITINDDKDKILIDGVKFTSIGIDDIDFLFSANPGEDMKPLNKVASGGELSRIMLAIKTNLAKSDKLDTLIFDEIDAGIGGRVATAVGRRLNKLSENHQVLVVTHLPQIAAFADNHIKIEKYDTGGKTHIKIEKLDKVENRVLEISRMLSGDLLSDSSLKHARELLEVASHH
jgi:DNA repair protein RecN (Recombination protein N)